MKKPESHAPAKTRKAETQWAFGPEALLSEQECAEEAGFEEEREHAFHGQGLSDDASGRFGETRPVGPELKFHGDAGDHAHGEIDGEYFCPEAGRAVVVLVAGAQGHGLEHQDQQREAHGQLRKEVVEGDGECEMQAVNGEGVHESNIVARREAGGGLPA